MACNMPKPCKFLSLDSFQKRFLWTHKEADLAVHPDAGLVLQAGDVEKFPLALGFESLDPFLAVSKQGPCFTAIEKNGGDKRLVELEFAYEVDGVAQLGLVVAGFSRAFPGSVGSQTRQTRSNRTT